MAAVYLLCPGWVTSQADGQDHYLAAADLARLYGVPMSECVVLPGALAFHSRYTRGQLLARVDAGDLVALRPRHDGDYRLPQSAAAS